MSMADILKKQQFQNQKWFLAFLLLLKHVLKGCWAASEVVLFK